MVKFALHFSSVPVAVNLNTTERLTEDDEITISGIEVLGKSCDVGRIGAPRSGV